MKKITGKVVSLVLALALVVTSFSGTFAFAATKSVSGTVSDTEHDTIYLANGGTNKNVKNFETWVLKELDTKDHKDVTDLKVSAISHASGDKLVKWDIDKDDHVTLTVKSSTDDGKEVLSILYEGTYSNEDGDDVKVKARKDFTVYVLDNDSIVIGKVYDSSASNFQKVNDTRTGKELEAPSDFAQTKNSEQLLGVYRVGTDSDAKAVYTPVSVTTKTPVAGDEYSVDSTGDVNLAVATGGKLITATVGKSYDTVKSLYTKDGSVANVTVTAKKVLSTLAVSTKSDDKYTLKSKIAKKIDVSAVPIYANATTFSIDKDNGKTWLGTANVKATDDSGAINVTDTEIVFPVGTTSVTVGDGSVKKISGTVGKLDIGDAKVSEVDIDNGDVTVADGTVGNITTDGTTGKVTVTSGKVGNIDTTDATADDVIINGGTVGTIQSDNEVTIEATDEDTAISTGKITALKVSAFSDEAKVTINGIKINAADGSVTLKGDDTITGTIDFDYRNTALNLGDEDDAFTGKIATPINATEGKIVTENEDTDATITGAVDVNTISVGSDTNLAFDGNITVDTIDGDGAMKIAAGKLKVTGSVSGVTLKLSDTTLVPGTKVFTADEDAVDVDDFTAFGFTLDKSNASDIDTFKIKTISFAGLAINKTASSIAKGYSETFTTSAYPGGTSLPTGATIKWDFDGSDDVFKVTTTGTTAKVEVLKVDSEFASENKGTLTAKLYDADGYELDDYDAAKTEITAIATPNAIIDTTKDFSVAAGASYQFKITSTTAPVVTYGTSGVFTGVLASHTGNDYFYKITATGKVGSSTGIYLNGAKVLVASVKAPAFKSDTTGNVTIKGSYTVKITATATPSFGVGTVGVVKAAFVSKNGNDYLYKVTSTGKVGAKTGVYVNGVKTFVAIVG